MTAISADLQARRSLWRWRGTERPPFAQAPGPGQESVWDYPRPPELRPDDREVIIRSGRREIARTRQAIRVLETAHPPSFYIPWSDIDAAALRPGTAGSFCEWKGAARYWSLVADGRTLEHVAWGYPQPLAGAEALADRLAFYPASLDCTVGGTPVAPQPGGYYGGWITPELVGPFKGEAGSSGW